MTRLHLPRAAALAATAGLLAGGLLGPTPAGAATGAVTGTATTTTAIRASAADGGVVVGTLQRGQKIPTTAQATAGWVSVRFRRQTAYVAATALTTATTKLPGAPTRVDPHATEVATARLKVRSSPSTGSAVVSRIAEGDVVTLTGKVRPGYAETVLQGRRRWVSVRYVVAAAPLDRSAAAAQAVAFAEAQLGKPYRYGAVGPDAFDCSGLTLSAWRAAGVTLPRTSQQQFAVGTKVALADLQPGDLVFFYGRQPGHVGLYLGDGMVVHAPRPGKTVEHIKLAFMPFSGARRPG